VNTGLDVTWNEAFVAYVKVLDWRFLWGVRSVTKSVGKVGLWGRDSSPLFCAYKAEVLMTAPAVREDNS
jgi:hypothetical protein